MSGSSPLTRGKLGYRAPRVARDGLIPAHAGKTTRDADEEGFEWGSSPLTRGKHGGVVTVTDEEGLIPAHAGKTAYTFLAVCTCGAHPRSRGENRQPLG